MYTEKRDSMIKKTLKTLCCSSGWCYGIFWGFDQRNSLLLTFKDAYYEEQMGALIDSMLLQAHVLGGGVIGQSAFTKNHRWMYSTALHERQNSLGSFDSLEVFQEDSEFFCQFSMGIKTIAVISVEPWGVVQLGSTLKNPEREGFVDQVKELFREIDILENESHSDGQVFDSSTQLNSVISGGISQSVDQNWRNGAFSGGLMEANHSLVLPSQSLPSTSDHQRSNLIFPSASPMENPSNFFDCSATQALSNHSDCSLFPSSWQFLEESMAFSTPMDYESCRNSSFNAPVNLEELFKHGLEDDFSQWFSPQLSSAPFTTLLSTENLPANSLQSSVTDAFRTGHEVKDSEMEKVLDTLGVEHGRKKARSWNETLIPVVNGDELNFSTGVSECISDKHVGSTTCTSNSLFAQLGLDQLLDGVARYDDQSSSATKRRKIDNLSWGHNQVKFEGLPSFDRKMKILNPMYEPETKNIELNSEESTKEPHSCVGDSCGIDAGKTGSSSMRQEEQAKTKKKKAKPGTRPRPKDRQMIQDRLSELRELIPNGEKMSIDRLLERAIGHLNFMQNLTKHAESLKQIDKPKSVEVQKNHSTNGGGGVTWACEVGDQSMVCPLVVEDLSTPGQMLIEMLCEEQGFFLEIVDIIRGFGLIIRKGVMEVRETKKIWAHFMVEAEGNRCVSRHEIFSSLIQLLQMTGQSAVNASDSYGNVVSSGRPSFNDFQPSASIPVNFADALRCGSL